MSIGNETTRTLHITGDGLPSPAPERPRTNPSSCPCSYTAALEELAILTEGVYNDVEDVDDFARRVREGEAP